MSISPSPAQKMITGYMEEAKVSFVTQEDYYNPDMDIGEKWIDVTQVPAKEKDRPFAHIANASCIDAFVKAILCEDNMEEHDLKFLEEGDIRDLVERRSAKLEAGSLGPHDRMEHTMRMYLHLDGAAAKGMPRKWGKTATSFKIRPAFMTQGCSQLNPPPLPPLTSTHHEKWCAPCGPHVTLVLQPLQGRGRPQVRVGVRSGRGQGRPGSIRG